MAAKKKSIRGTRTEANLVKAYISESAAYSRYTYYSKQATKESYFPIARAFAETAANELHHGKTFFKYLEGGKVDVSLNVDAGVIGSTLENLATAADEEQNEGVVQYTEAAKVADEEGFPEIAESFRSIAKVEERHERRFRKFYEQVKNGTVWKRDKPIRWQCLVCGFVYVGIEPPLACPACDHPREHYMALDEDND
ncbi:MAG: rubrerythrin family protein [Paramuribaculum sp.]|nr:rubrerythrin family protein [Paramuribaculum sp.]